MIVTCEVCNESSSKYKCASCYIPYCSVYCWKRHKNENNCESKASVKESVQPISSSNKTKYFTEDTVSEEKLKLLGESEKLKEILKNKYLKNTLVAVNDASNPEKAIQQAMKDPQFVEFVDECLKIVEDTND